MDLEITKKSLSNITATLVVEEKDREKRQLNIMLKNHLLHLAQK